MVNRISTAFLATMMMSIACTPTTVHSVQAKEESWAVYWYLCGSDLESDGGAATTDLAEMMECEMPENVTVIVETGGAQTWQNKVIDENYLERYVYNEDGFNCVDQQPSANMGEAATLIDFLDFCQTNYPADHEAVVFWDHGAGSAQGVIFDELYNYDSLSLSELKTAFETVYGASGGKKPLEMIGFDACLMATIDTANIFSDYAHYMVASEETEPGDGWNYTGWLGALADDPSMNGAQLGTIICDTYAEGCAEIGQEKEITLSVTDLDQFENLLNAYNDLGAEALENQKVNASFYSEFSRGAKSAEYYGGDVESSNSANMVDLGDLLRQNEQILPEHTSDVLKALDDAIVYKINGSYRQQATGLSCYFSYNNNSDEFEQYSLIGASEAFTGFYRYCLTGEVTEEQAEYLETIEILPEELQEVPTLEYCDSEDFYLSLDEDGYATLELDEDTVDALSSVYFQLGCYDEDEDWIIWLGTDNDLDTDWENGIFKDNFRGVWGAIDGHICYMDIIYEGDDYNLYIVPILLNGEDYQLHVVYDYEYDEFEILGARKGLDENGMSDRNLTPLEPGDVISTMLYVSSYSGDDEPELIEWEEFTVTEDTYFEEEDLGDGNFLMAFELIDTHNEAVWTDEVYFEVEDGEIYADI